MKQIAQNYKSGELIVLDVPAPVCRPGGVLVRSLFSLISTGTEMMKLTEAKLSMGGKARARPDQVRKVLDSVAQQGAVATYKKVSNPAATRAGHQAHPRPPCNRSRCRPGARPAHPPPDTSGRERLHQSSSPTFRGNLRRKTPGLTCRSGGAHTASVSILMLGIIVSHPSGSTRRGTVPPSEHSATRSWSAGPGHFYYRISRIKLTDSTRYPGVGSARQREQASRPVGMPRRANHTIIRTA